MMFSLRHSTKRHSTKRHSADHEERGFTLIEVLIALFVFAIGILTVAGLQIVSKKSNYEAVQRTTATLIAQDIVQRMRANDPDVWGAYLQEDLGNSSLGAPKDCVGAAVTCSAADFVNFDLYAFEQALDGATEANTGGLVNPSACIRGPAGGGDGTYSVIIAWRGVTELSNPTIDAGVGGMGSCGAGDYGTNDAYRRVVVFTTFLAP